MGAYGEKLNFSGEQKIRKNVKKELQILMGIAPRVIYIFYMIRILDRIFFYRVGALVNATYLGVHSFAKLQTRF